MGGQGTQQKTQRKLCLWNHLLSSFMRANSLVSSGDNSSPLAFLDMSRKKYRVCTCRGRRSQGASWKSGRLPLLHHQHQDSGPARSTTRELICPGRSIKRLPEAAVLHLEDVERSHVGCAHEELGLKALISRLRGDPGARLPPAQNLIRHTANNRKPL